MFLQTLLRPKFILYNYSNLDEHDENLAEVLLKKHQGINIFFIVKICVEKMRHFMLKYIFSTGNFFFK